MKNWLYLFSLSNFAMVILCIVFFNKGLFFAWLIFPIIAGMTTMAIDLKKRNKHE
jgi:hypothetical protein